jgi:hypothetical protein
MTSEKKAEKKWGARKLDEALGDLTRHPGAFANWYVKAIAENAQREIARLRATVRKLKAISHV